VVRRRAWPSGDDLLEILRPGCHGPSLARQGLPRRGCGGRWCGFRLPGSRTGGPSSDALAGVAGRCGRGQDAALSQELWRCDFSLRTAGFMPGGGNTLRARWCKRADLRTDRHLRAFQVRLRTDIRLRGARP
jgi:hypothetical protein